MASLSLIALFWLGASTYATAVPPTSGGIALEVAALASRFQAAESDILQQLKAQHRAVSARNSLLKEKESWYAGSWYDAQKKKLVVGTTDPNAFAAVNRHNAIPVLVEWNFDELEMLKGRVVELANTEGWWNAGLVHGIFVRQRANRVIVEVAEGVEDRIRGALVDSGLNDEAILLTPSLGPLGVRSTVIPGGEQFLTSLPQSCSYGFPVHGPSSTVGYITAGHCGHVGNTVTNTLSVSQGSVVQSTFPPSSTWVPPEPGQSGYWERNFNPDRLYVQNSVGWNPYFWHHSIFTVLPESSLIEGIYVCRRGATTGGPHCGDIDAYPVDHPGSSFYNPTLGAWINVTFTPMIRANVCAEPGDSGGPLYGFAYPLTSWILPAGTLTGAPIGSAPCASSSLGPSLYAPVEPTLNAFGLSLKTGL